MATTFYYEFGFPSGFFDQAVYNACPILDKLGKRQAVIEATVINIQSVFNNNVLNLHKFSTFVDHDNKSYKVTVTNPAWIV
jgi:hypothetical protein